ncbi:MAG: hypothetical protein WBO29_18160 [Albidovulum sp.]
MRTAFIATIMFTGGVLFPITTYSQTMTHVFETACLSSFPDYQAGAENLRQIGFKKQKDGTWRSKEFLVNPSISGSSGKTICSVMNAVADPELVIEEFSGVLTRQRAEKITVSKTVSGRKAKFDFKLGKKPTTVRIEPFLTKGAFISIYEN